MAIDNKRVIDMVSIDKNDMAILTIVDHLEWDGENEHLIILQDKINSYLAAIESHELYEKYPKAIDKNICIRIVSFQEPNHDGLIFLERTKEIIENAGYRFEFRQHE
jgi:uncharacterized protein DUF6572